MELATRGKYTPDLCERVRDPRSYEKAAGRVREKTGTLQNTFEKFY